MSIQLLTTCKPESIRATAETMSENAQRLTDEFTPLNLKALALLDSDWEGEAASEFRKTWIDFREGCAILVDVMREGEPILMRLFVRLSIAKDRFEKAVAEARAAGLLVDMTTGEVTAPPIVLNSGPGLPFNRELEVADQVRRANLDIQDAIREATEADQRADEELAALEPSIDRLTLILRALGVAMEGYGGIAGTLGGVASGLSGTVSAQAQQWKALADHPIFRAANIPLAEGVPVLRSIPRLGALGVPVTYASNIASGDNPARSATRAIASAAGSFVGGSVGVAATSALVTGIGAVAMATPPGVVVIGLGFVAGVGLSVLGAHHGDRVGGELHDHVISPLMDRIEGTAKDWLG